MNQNFNGVDPLILRGHTITLHRIKHTYVSVYQVMMYSTIVSTLIDAIDISNLKRVNDQTMNIDNVNCQNINLLFFTSQ
jgi:hypothetical protein